MLTDARAVLVADAERIARFLAGRGWLLPSVLSDAEVMDLGCHDREQCQCEPGTVRAELERIAKGEQ